MAQVAADKQVRDRDMIATIPYPGGGSITVPGSAVKFSDFTTTFTFPPAFGRHTREVLCELLGYGDAAISELKAEGAIQLERRAKA